MIVYQYACQMRPPAPGAVPVRNLVNVVGEHIPISGTDRHYWGLVEYSQPLTDEEIDMYELDPVGTAETEE